MRVLVIEDNRIDRLAIARLLDDEVLELHWTNDGEPGLRMIEELPRPLIVILDLHLITMDASEVLEQLGIWPEDLRIFVMTGDDEPELRADILEHPVAGYLTKQSIEEHDLRAILDATWHELTT
jgi:CheY-like chemotaxis protein